MEEKGLQRESMRVVNGYRGKKEPEERLYSLIQVPSPLPRASCVSLLFMDVFLSMQCISQKSTSWLWPLGLLVF